MPPRRKRKRNTEMFAHTNDESTQVEETTMENASSSDDLTSGASQDFGAINVSEKEEQSVSDSLVSQSALDETPISDEVADDVKPDVDELYADFDYRDPLFGGKLADEPEKKPAGYYGAEYGLGENEIEVPAGNEIEFAEDYTVLPAPEVFNAYPPEVQRKIMEWRDRDVRARRDDESRRRDELMRAKVEQERRDQVLPVVVTVLALICGAVSGIATGSPLFPIAFLIVPLAVIGARLAGGARKNSSRDKYRKPPQK